MGTEDYWQKEIEKNRMNAGNINPIISMTMEDNKKIVPPKHAKALYADCLQGALFWEQWARSEDLSLNEMGMMICRDVGCELTYCQATLSDPYERPFENCDQQFKAFNQCIAQEQRRYIMNPEGRSMHEHIQYMLAKKKKEKYFNILEVKAEDREYIIKEKDSLTNTIIKNKL
jgi:hypothetical protein